MSERQLVAVDIGGTHARFVIATIGDDGAIALDEPVTLKTEDHASFQTAWEDFGRIQGGDLPKAVSIAVAGPVGGDVIRFTNNPWIIRAALVKEKLKVDAYTIVNDFGAVGHAVARAPNSDFLHLTSRSLPRVRSASWAPARALAWRMSGATAQATTACRRPRAGTSTSPRTT